MSLFEGVAPHAYQLKTLVVPQNKENELNSHKQL